MTNQPSQLPDSNTNVRNENGSSFRVTSISLFTLPTAIYNVECGMPITIDYTAQFHLEGNLSGGIITFECSTNMWQTTKVGSITVEAGETSVLYHFLGFDMPMAGMHVVGSGIIRSVSPNQITSNIGKVEGYCREARSIWNPM